MFETPEIRAAASVALAFSFIGSVFSFATFVKFSWLRVYPRSLYFYFTAVDLGACLASITVLATHEQAGCYSKAASIIVYHFFWLTEYLLICCMCHSVYYQLSGMDMQLTATNDVDSLLGHRAKRATYQRVYHVICGGIPVVYTTIVLIAYQGGCGMDGHKIDYMLTYQIPDLITFFACVVMAIVNVRKAKKVLRLLDLHSHAEAQGSIHKDSITFHKVFVGMFVTFGLLRFPSVLRSLIHILGFGAEGGSIFTEDAAEHAMDVMAGFTVPVQVCVCVCGFSRGMCYGHGCAVSCCVCAIVVCHVVVLCYMVSEWWMCITFGYVYMAVPVMSR